jgi:hypothetical protein
VSNDVVSDPKLQLLSESAVTEALGDDDVHVFGYILNVPAIVLLFVMAGLFYALGGILWWVQGLNEGMWIAAFVVLCGVGSSFSIAALYWQNYAKTRLIAVSDDYLWAGTKEAAWQIDWELLDLEALGVSEMEQSKLSGRMVVKVGAERIPLDIFRGFVVLDDVPAFILAVLEKLDPELAEQVDEVLREPETPAGDDTSAA